ncbi:EAL domain-containing protein [uncultured Ferrimonas sp.]|uniref:putative bifunctional diguanylate cyclase/phosphodiesterase n=1 Tax=uncultured Ferrimonas sp. TaxID=432640 RepID=UPI00262BB620|nr:EAL domain-containing protein [uncultured Ferrimonas sp.]
MRLVHRLNYILLPVIAAVFLIAGLLVYYAFVQQAKLSLGEKWQRQLSYTQQEIQLEQKGIRSRLVEELKSSTAVDFMLAPQSAYRIYTIEQQIFNFIAINKQNGFGVQAFQLIGPDGKIWLSADQQSPFGPRQLLPLPDNISQQALQSIKEKRTLVPIEAISADGRGNAQYALAQQFNPSLPQEIGNPQFNDNFLILQRATLASFNKLKRTIQQQLGEHAQLQLLPADPLLRTGIASEQQMEQLQLVLSHRLYQLRLSIDYEVLEAELAQIQTNITRLLLVMILLCFFVQRWLIHSQIVNPINELAERLNHSRINGGVQLAPMNNDDEVSHLNNAYLGLMEQMQQLATFDPLTGLANRRSFQEWLSRVLPRLQHQPEQRLALLYIDLDNFKRVNDQHGHTIGDRLLQRFSQQLQQVVRASDTVTPLGHNDRSLARLAGDEFAVLLTDISNPTDVSIVAERINRLFNNGFKVDRTRHNVQASIGIAIYPDDGLDAHTLIAHADAAMYQAKSQGKNSYQFFSSDIEASLQQKQLIETTLAKALQRNAFELVYMPICDANSLQILGVEALLRCPQLTSQGIGPDQFIPVAESTGLIHQIDLWVLEHSMQHLLQLQLMQQFNGFIAINISAVELHNHQFPEHLALLLRRYQLDPAKIELEITETSLVADDADCHAILARLKQLGVRLALDDFGTGYTAFNQLASYPVDVLKIDRTFVNKLAGQKTDEQSMLDIILSLARLYQLSVVAEGVETEEQLHYLQQCGCDKVQGYYLGKPMPLAQLQHTLLQGFDCRPAELPLS